MNGASTLISVIASVGGTAAKMWFSARRRRISKATIMMSAPILDVGSENVMLTVTRDHGREGNAIGVRARLKNVPEQLEQTSAGKVCASPAPILIWSLKFSKRVDTAYGSKE